MRRATICPHSLAMPIRGQGCGARLFTAHNNGFGPVGVASACPPRPGPGSQTLKNHAGQVSHGVEENSGLQKQL